MTWELTPEGDGCRVQVTHSGWTTAHEAAEKTGAGWREILGLLKNQLETGKLPVKTRIMYTVMGWLMFAMPAKTRTENVDRGYTIPTKRTPD